MKLIIAGSRGLNGRHVKRAIARHTKSLEVTELVTGGCAGVDRMGMEWAATVGAPIKIFWAEWEKHGRAAGPIRNEEMARYADALLLIWDGRSPGSRSMKALAQKHGLTIMEEVFG